MSFKVDVDSRSGFCGGVIRAIRKAEDFLDAGQPHKLYSLGSIVHNGAELSRLGAKGLVTIGHDDIESLDKENDTLFIRAHGEPPSTYQLAAKFGINVIDCTCPVVLRLQKSIKEAYKRIKEGDNDGQIIIFGKIGHAEVLGLLGQVDGDALVIENREMLVGAIDSDEVKLAGPVEIFSQTTKSPAEYSVICSVLEEAMAKYSELPVERFRGTDRFIVHNTVCSQVANRHAHLSAFALSHDIVIFVASKESSNGRVLYDLCKSVNIRTYRVASESEIRKEWFRKDDNVGVCGATSTPKWLLEGIAQKILQLGG